MATIDILLPTPLRGSGGHRTIVVNAEHLAELGHHVRLHVQKQRRQRDPVGKTRQWYPVRQCDVLEGWPDELPESDAVMATAWFTADAAATIPGPDRRLYFVQDYEPLFHPAGDLSLAASATYGLGLQTLVIGNWLRHVLWRDHQVPTATVPFTADITTYHAVPDTSRRRQVAAVYQPDKPRRCPDLVRAALRLVLEAGVEVVTFGGEKSPHLGQGHRHVGLQTPAELCELYQRSAAGLCISASNPSRLPFEMMACGLPVVEAYLPSTVYDLPDSGALLARPDAASVARALLKAVHSDPGSWQGPRHMADRPHSLEADAFARFVLGEQVPEPIDPQPIYSRPAFA